MAKSKKCTTVGCIPKSLVKQAIREWNREQQRVNKLPNLRDSFTSYVAMVPAPPIPGTPAYSACINSWYMSMMKASQLDSLYQQEAQIHGQRMAGEPIFTVLVGAYVDCMSGYSA